MHKKTVVEYFGSQTKTAKALGITVQAVFQWNDIIPELQAMRLAHMTRGELKFDESLYRGSAA